MKTVFLGFRLFLLPRHVCFLPSISILYQRWCFPVLMRFCSCQVAAAQLYHFSSWNAFLEDFTVHFCWENLLVKIQVEKVKREVYQQRQAAEGGQPWTWVTLKLVLLVLRGGCCCVWKCGTSTFAKASFWWVHLDNNWVIQVCPTCWLWNKWWQQMSSGRSHCCEWEKHHLWLFLIFCSRVNINWMEKNY